jgi:hypothetical protein
VASVVALYRLPAYPARVLVIPRTNRVKAAVMDVIENEKRPGGTLDSRATG